MDFLCGLDISFSQPANHSLHANISESPFRRLALSLVIHWFMSMAQVELLLIRTQMPDETQTCHFSYLDICMFTYKLDHRPGHLHLKGNSELFPIMPSLWFIWKLYHICRIYPVPLFEYANKELTVNQNVSCKLDFHFLSPSLSLACSVCLFCCYLWTAPSVQDHFQTLHIFFLPSCSVFLFLSMPVSRVVNLVWRTGS